MSYDAFICYRRSSDEALASAIEVGLQRLACPFWRWAALSVYRDRSKQGMVAASLTDAIASKLDVSRWFVLVASPESARSGVVRDEVRMWLDRHGVERLLIFVAAGELHWDRAASDFIWDERCPLPPELRGRLSHNQLWLDMRAFREGSHSLRDPAFLDAVASLAVPMHGLADKTELHSRERRQRQRFVRVASWPRTFRSPRPWVESSGLRGPLAISSFEAKSPHAYRDACVAEMRAEMRGRWFHRRTAWPRCGLCVAQMRSPAGRELL